jgi:hypothetical protein
METPRSFFRLCSSCKKELAFGATYFRCSVSTCNRARVALSFCSVACFEAHVPTVRHREAWAEEDDAPTREEWERELAAAAADVSAAAATASPSPVRAAVAPAPRPERRIVSSVGAISPLGLKASGLPRDVLIVASKLKAYVRARSDMNTSDSAFDVLSDIVRELCDAAIQKAHAEGRKTVMDRDF